jgi:hypothetical protein
VAARAWEQISTSEEACLTERLKVPGGWIVRSRFSTSVHQVFIADSEHTWVVVLVDQP